MAQRKSSSAVCMQKPAVSQLCNHPMHLMLVCEANVAWLNKKTFTKLIGLLLGSAAVKHKP